MSVSSMPWKHSEQMSPACAAAGALMAIVGEDLVCRSISEPFAAFFGRTPSEMVGRTVGDFVESAMAAERETMFRQVLATARSLQFTEALGNTRFRTTFIPAEVGADGEMGVLIILAPLYLLPAGAATGLPHARHNHGDPLEGLTRAEVELLTLIGRGLSSQDIAEKLHRSIKTIESHRASLGRKLNIANRVELALIAVRAGLVSLLPSEKIVAAKAVAAPATTAN